MFRSITILLFFTLSLAAEPYDAFQFRKVLLQLASDEDTELMSKVNRVMFDLQQFMEKANSPEVKKIVKSFQENYSDFKMCKDIVGDNLSRAGSCVKLTEDFANFTAFILNAADIGYNMGKEIVSVVGELKNCSGESIFKQISCYKHAFKDIQDTIEKYSLDCSQLLENAIEVLKDTEVDISSCFHYSEEVSAKEFNQKFQLCRTLLT